uniref:Uncharacterized protein n=1 Tax=Anguilla anguilla TaxID=7936 RepID=A0A0E9Q472_ANGAN
MAMKQVLQHFSQKKVKKHTSKYIIKMNIYLYSLKD